ncbi:MAG: GNAT family N-acetyltransferase [Maribacter sp.]
MVLFKQGTVADVERIAALHAESWRQHYQDAFSTDFLEHKVVQDRLTVWKERLQHPKPDQYVLIAEENDSLLGFLCSYFNENSEHGTYLDNLHVKTEAKARGIGTRLMANLAEQILDRNENRGFYLWVLATNLPAIVFYERIGGERLESVEANDIGDRTFTKTRYVWKDMKDFLKSVASKF